MEWQEGLHFSPNERLAQWITEPPCTCEYVYGGNKKKRITPLRYPAFSFEDCPVISCLKERVEQVVQYNFNATNVNFYGSEKCVIPEHSDFEKLFHSSRNQQFKIASISLGTPRALVVRRKNSDSSNHITLNPLDIMVMEGTFQRDYTHQILQTSHKCGPRLNFTFRTIINHTSTCSS